MMFLLNESLKIYAASNFANSPKTNGPRCIGPLCENAEWVRRLVSHHWLVEQAYRSDVAHLVAGVR